MSHSLDYYKNLVKQYNKRIDKIRRENRQAQENADRLQRAYNEMLAIKRYNAVNAVALSKKIRRKDVVSGFKWRGDSKKKFDNTLERDAYRAAKEFEKSIDRMLDSINNAKRDELNKRRSGSFVLDTVVRSRNRILTIIQNWTN